MRRIGYWIVLAAGALLIVACAGLVAPTPSPTAAPFTAPPPPEGLNTLFGDGTHLVPDDVEPGTYRTTTYTQECYWVRFSGFSSGLEDWIASGIGPGYHVVTIGPDDAGFDSTGCVGWTDQIVPVTASPNEFGEGTYVVGTDMQPGTWRAASGANCYWARLSGFGGTEEELVEESLATDGAAPTVTIAPTDVGFTSNGCGSWSAEAPQGALLE